MMGRIQFLTVATALILGLAACKRGAPGGGEEAAGLEDAAAQRLHAMSDLMKASTSFSFKTVEDHHRVKANGEERDEHFTRETIVRRPDAVWFHRVKDGRDLYVWYDGKTLTARADSLKVWAQIDMPPTLDEGLDYLATTFHFPMPIGDLLYSDPYTAFIGDSTKGKIVGEEDVAGVKCQHLAFTDPVVDFDVWVEQGERPLPCRLDIRYKTLDGPPHSSITFTDWNLSPQIPADQFTASIPPDYRQIPVVGVADTTGVAAAGADTGGAPAESTPRAGPADTTSP